MATQPLATPDDAEAFGVGTVSEPYLLKATVRVREFTKQHISLTTSTVQASGPTVYLPQRPFRSVLSITDMETGDPVRFALGDRGTVRLNSLRRCLITYEHGYDPVPDNIIELVCEIAARLQSISPALKAGMQQGSAGGESASFGWDSHTGVAGLTSAEKSRLSGLFPRLPRLIVQRS